MPKTREELEVLAHAEPDIKKCLCLMLKELGSLADQEGDEGWLDSVTEAVDSTLRKCKLLKKAEGARDEIGRSHVFKENRTPKSTADILQNFNEKELLPEPEDEEETDV